MQVLTLTDKDPRMMVLDVPNYDEDRMVQVADEEVYDDVEQMDAHIEEAWLDKRLAKERKQKELLAWAKAQVKLAQEQVAEEIHAEELMEKKEVQEWVAAERKWFLSGKQRKINRLKHKAPNRTWNEEFEYEDLLKEKQNLINTRLQLHIPFGFAQDVITAR